MIEIDGSYGEGGGSIVRLAAAFSAVTGKAVSIHNIRKNREKPGLMPQHLTAVKAVAQLCNAKTKGLHSASTSLEFVPGKLQGGNYELNVGTAGSVSLVLQALMIPAFHSLHEVDVILKGGTHIPHAPSVFYLQEVIVPLLRKIGYRGEITCRKYGFFPKGGGIATAAVLPSKLKGISLTERGSLQEVNAYIACSEDLKERNVAERIKKSVETALAPMKAEVKSHIEYHQTASPGCAVDLVAKYKNSILAGSSLGELKKTAEQVGTEAAEMLLRQHASKAAIDEHAADQILPYLVIAEGKSEISAVRITEHAMTNLWLLEKFSERRFSMQGNRISIE